AVKQEKNTMNSLGLAAFFVAIAVANAGYHAGVVGGLGAPAVITGPSGAVITSGVAHGGIVAPGIYGAGLGAAGAIIAPATAGAVVAPGLGLLGHGLLAGSGIEGQYVHDHSELLYDDGSYKPYLYGH
ncbi:hypothetical protein, partial [Nocardioides abyssi]